MKITMISPEEFEKHQLDFSNANFLQSRQMGEVHAQRGSYENSFFVAWHQENDLVAQALVVVRRRMRFFKEAVLFQGPLFHEQSNFNLKDLLETLETFLKEKGIARVEMIPYLMNTELDEELQVMVDHRYDDLVHDFCESGYERFTNFESGIDIHQIFRKKLTEFEDAEDVYNHFSNSMKRNLRKFADSNVVVREVDADHLDVFYKILTETADRKEFSVQPFQYFQLLKDNFGSQAKFMVAYLDVTAYKAYYTEQIAYFEQRIKELEEQEAHATRPSKKTKGMINDAKDQLGSYQKRKVTFEEMNISSDLLPLSSNLFICYANEVINLFGGSYTEYKNFGGATLLNWQMMKYAKEEGFDYYNFYGTLETSQTSHNDGNFNFKRQFGGRLERLTGRFSKNLNPMLTVLMQLKK